MTAIIPPHAGTTALVSMDAAAPLDDGNVNLSPDALIAYCEARLNDNDKKIQDMMNNQETSSWEQQQLGGIQTQLTQLQNTINGAGGNDLTSASDSSSVQALQKQLRSVISQIEIRDPNCPVLGQLKDLHDNLMATGTPPTADDPYYGTPPQGPDNNSGSDGILSTSEITGFNQTLTSITNSLSSNSQIEMVKIQSAVSASATIVQMATNMMQTEHDTEMKVVGNYH
jgi:hypothetical protein